MNELKERFETPHGIFYKDEPIEIITNYINIVGLFNDIIQSIDDGDISIIVSEPMKAIINGYDYNKNGYKINYIILPFSLFSYTNEISIPISSIIKINRINKKVYELFIKPHYNSFLNDISELDNLVNIFETNDINLIKTNKFIKKYK